MTLKRNGCKSEKKRKEKKTTRRMQSSLADQLQLLLSRLIELEISQKHLSNGRGL